MTFLEIETLTRQNQYLKQRVAQLEEDVSNLTADNGRLRQRLDRVSARPAAAPAPLGGGQEAVRLDTAVKTFLIG